jgi:glycosyltransferase involved in cell wall biosynthesis
MRYYTKVKLLIVTQVVDKNHPVLGFFCGWIEEFSQKCDSVIVIGQQCGAYEFPENVTVLSLGKENAYSKTRQVRNFYSYIRKHHSEYDTVFVHMIPLWVILGSILWKNIKKPVYLWYEARSRTLALRISLLFVHKHFSASEAGMLVHSKKHHVIGHGIDTDLFTYNSTTSRLPIIISVGRITAAKKPLEILECFKQLHSTYTLRFAGIAVHETDKKLYHELEQNIAEYNLKEQVTIEPCNYQDIVSLYTTADMLIHMSTTPLDKALLEAMACGCIIVGNSIGIQTVAPNEYSHSVEDCSTKLQLYMHMSEEQKTTKRQEMRSIVVEQHGIQQCIERICSHMHCY